MAMFREYFESIRGYRWFPGLVGLSIGVALFVIIFVVGWVVFKYTQ